MFSYVVRVCSDSRVPRGHGNAIGEGQVGQLVLEAGQHWQHWKPEPHVAVSKQNKLPFPPKTNTHSPWSILAPISAQHNMANRTLVRGHVIIKLISKASYAAYSAIRRNFSVQTLDVMLRSSSEWAFMDALAYISPVNEASVALPLCILFTVPPGVLHSSTRLHRSYFLLCVRFPPSRHPLSEKGAGIQL